MILDILLQRALAQNVLFINSEVAILIETKANTPAMTTSRFRLFPTIFESLNVDVDLGTSAMREGVRRKEPA